MFKKHKVGTGTEILKVETAVARYDVASFRKRIETIKDEDGLYDVTVPQAPTDFTGAERLLRKTTKKR